MKTIGLLGGMSWESTIAYYRAINEEVKNTLGDLHSAKIAMYSADFAPLEKLQHIGGWNGTAIILSEAATKCRVCCCRFFTYLHEHSAQSCSRNRKIN